MSVEEQVGETAGAGLLEVQLSLSRPQGSSSEQQGPGEPGSEEGQMRGQNSSAAQGKRTGRYADHCGDCRYRDTRHRSASDGKRKCQWHDRWVAADERACWKKHDF